jgi:hypothetical protein
VGLGTQLGAGRSVDRAVFAHTKPALLQLGYWAVILEPFHLCQGLDAWIVPSSSI